MHTNSIVFSDNHQFQSSVTNIKVKGNVLLVQFIYFYNVFAIVNSINYKDVLKCYRFIFGRENHIKTLTPVDDV